MKVKASWTANGQALPVHADLHELALRLKVVHAMDNPYGLPTSWTTFKADYSLFFSRKGKKAKRIEWYGKEYAHSSLSVQEL